MGPGRETNRRATARVGAPVASLAHRLGNTLGAVKLRLDMIMADSTCMWAQGDNLQVLVQLVREATVEAEELEATVRSAETWP